MGPYRLFINLFITILVIAPSSKSQDWCPSDCTCTTSFDTTQQNHAKCTSLKGILESKNLPIHNLTLSNANLTKITHLDKLRALTAIDLSNNKLSDIGNLGPRIKSINLSHNKITSAKLVNLPRNVEELDLSYNEITYLPLELSKTKLRRIELLGNKLNCTCDTLEVRNWLVKNSVFTSHPVKCTYPIELKGTLWMQIKQESVCKVPNTDEYEKLQSEKMLDDENENELMLGDAPIVDNSDEKDNTDDNEELGKDYMPIKNKTEDVIDDNVEGSGFSELSHLPMQNDKEYDDKTPTTTVAADGTDEDDDEGSGSGIGFSFNPSIEHNSNESEANTTVSTDMDDVSFVETENSDSKESTPIPAPTDESTTRENIGLGIFGFDSDSVGTSDNTTIDERINVEEEQEQEATEAVLIPVHVHETESVNNETDNVDVLPPGSGTDLEKDEMVAESDIDKAEAGESNSTYILLGTVLIILVCLLMYVGLKKMIKKRKHNERDAERAAELVDMDKKNLGKPLQKNGNEQKPLIGTDNIKPVINGTKKPYTDNDEKTQEPLLNGHHKDPRDDESNNNLVKPHNQEEPTIPVPEPRQSLQQPQHQQQPSSPRVHSPRFGGYPPPRSPDTTDGNMSSPSSPKTGRYSPVYSPETGKVKIKLSEIPKPKTPMLVTKGRSNAGDIIITPTSDVAEDAIPNNEK